MIALSPPGWCDAGPLAWPGTPVLGVAAADPAEVVLAVLDAVTGPGGAEAVVVAADAPDLPQLLLGKLFSALSTAEVAVCPTLDGGLVALASVLPAPDWLRGAAVGLDTPHAVGRLRQAAPDRRSFVVGPGWHRLQRPADLGLLDPGLEGWERTRALLAGHALRG